MESKKILAVDDSNLSRRRFVAQPLREAGFEVVEAVDGEDGLNAVEEHDPDIIVSDLLMPVMDGFEFIAALRERGVATPVIVASADIQESTRQKLEELGTFAFMNKPFKSTELVATVEQAIDSLVAEVSK
ncbi:MAG: response regulator [Planctomycetota bacterium]